MQPSIPAKIAADELTTVHAAAPTAPPAVGRSRLSEEEAMEGAAYYLSLEFILNGNTYWLCTCCRGVRPRHFVAVPQQAFEGRTLHPGGLHWAGGNSEIYLTSEMGAGARFTPQTDGPFEELDLAPLEHVGWNSVCDMVLDLTPCSNWSALYLLNEIRQKDPAVLKLPDVAYFVTAFDVDENVVAICGEDHDPPNTINWRAYEGLDTPVALRSLLKNFKVQSISLGGRLVPVE